MTSGISNVAIATWGIGKTRTGGLSPPQRRKATHMKKLMAICLALTAVNLFSPAAVTAAEKDSAQAEKTEAKEKFRPFRGTIKSVDATAKSITLEGEKAQTFAVASDAKLTKEGKPATFADLAIGDAVGGRAKETGEGKWTAVTINAGKKAEKAPEEKEKK